MPDSPEPTFALTTGWFLPLPVEKQHSWRAGAWRNAETAASLSHRKLLLSHSQKVLLSLGLSACNELPADLQDDLLLGLNAFASL